MLESRKINMIFTRAGSGSVSTKLAIPKSWVDKMNVTQEEREVIVEFDGERVTVRKMNEKEKLIERIDRAIEEKAMRTGAMGTESVTVRFELTDEEKELFSEIDKYDDDEHYWWDFDGNELSVTYTEEKM